MPNLPRHFAALLHNVNPSVERARHARELPAQVRDWLEERDDLTTVAPYSRLIGSYSRSTAILDIKDIDTLLFYDDATLERTPESVLRELKKALDDYPDATAEASPQRRSIHLCFEDPEVHLDIVPAVAPNGLEKALKIPDRKKEEWLVSDPLGYARSLSTLNAKSQGNLIRLIKLLKSWRDVQMKHRRIKSYVLEIMAFKSIDSAAIETEGHGLDTVLMCFFEHIAEKYEEPMDSGIGVPRIPDPQTGAIVTTGWERSHFETFMRRIREAAKKARKAVDGERDEAIDSWSALFGDHWPTDEEVKSHASLEASGRSLGAAYVSPAGLVTDRPDGISTTATRFHGDRP